MSVQEFEALFKSSIQRLTFIHEAPLFYEGQFLSGVYFIKKGKVNFSKKKTIQRSLCENHIIGFGPILYSEEANQNAIVEKNSEILFVSKFEALKKMKQLSINL